VIPAYLWSRYHPIDADPKPRRPRSVPAKVAPENAHRRYQAGDGPVRRSITAAIRDQLRTGKPVREVTPGG
jgi:hypothetical protein